MKVWHMKHDVQQQLYMLDVVWRLAELRLVWLEVVVTAPFFMSLNQQTTLLVERNVAVVSHLQHSELILLVHVSQDGFSKCWLWIHTLLLICYCDAGREERGALDSCRRSTEIHKCVWIQLMNLHDLCLWTEDTWIMNDWHVFDELCVDPAHKTVQTPACIRSAACVSCSKKTHNLISCWSQTSSHFLLLIRTFWSQYCAFHCAPFIWQLQIIRLFTENTIKDPTVEIKAFDHITFTLLSKCCTLFSSQFLMFGALHEVRNIKVFKLKPALKRHILIIAAVQF